MDSVINDILDVLTHVFVPLFLIVYLPISWLWKLFCMLVIRPFVKEKMEGKVVLITGASSGIGEQLAFEYARRGASLALVARREHVLKTAAKKALELGAPDVLIIPADVSSLDESKRIIHEAVTHFGKLNHLVVNAGIWGSSFFEEISNIKAFKQVMDVNFWGSVYPTYYAIPHLKNTKGKIIVTSSVAGYLQTPGMSIYNASKAAMIKFYETLRSELGSEVGITIATPGWIASDLTRGKAVHKTGEVKFDEEARDSNIGPLPIGNTEQYAKLVVDNVCIGAKYVTWPYWYRPFCLCMFLAPELVDWFSRTFYVSKYGEGSGKALSKKIMEWEGTKKFLYPPSILSPNSKNENKDE